MRNFISRFFSLIAVMALTLLVTATAFAADAAMTGLPVLDTVRAAISSVPGAVWAGLTFLLESAQRMWPTANPQGILIRADQLCKKVGAVIAQLGGIFLALDEVLNHVVPQNVAAPAMNEAPSAPPQA